MPGFKKSSKYRNIFINTNVYLTKIKSTWPKYKTYFLFHESGGLDETTSTLIIIIETPRLYMNTGLKSYGYDYEIYFYSYLLFY